MRRHDDHDEFGGLHRDLRMTGAAMDRRQAGRWPHIHFEVYPSLASATSSANRIATSQIALPKSTCDLVYITTGYQQSVTNLSQVSLATDNVFSDGASLELATVIGSVASGLTASLSVAI